MSRVHSSNHFSLEKVSDGIYAAFAKEGGGAVGNAGFVDLGDKTIVFDTFNTQQSAEDLKQMAESITERPVSWVINSHWHGDHVRGNQAFNESNIVSSDKTFKNMKEIHPERISKQKNDLAGLQNYIETLEEKAKETKESKETKDEKINLQISFLHEIEKSLPDLQLVLPNYTFKDEFTIYGSKRSARLFTLGGGHSICDSMLYIPENKTMFSGDLVAVDTHPALFEESNPEEWLAILNKLKEMEIETIIPGHGPVGNKQNVYEIFNYIKHLLKAVSESSEGNVLPENYKRWLSPEIYQQNIKTISLKD
ncbi:MBL fold metallo-hydrolase [Pseudalkalibacillus caeni]|uniref:MBL fold metallo-hydrolase n=1 Tax=Exobacillus caeni TaxID=2574798 RepID=A0A5R9F426_9BACL|nr:MBL fold metallo-hydrolase [Pseudalkalibacillus caeni]TLS37140.1 MBL fold metallo-hydrolase [Pseudalkalibacillus caeni]